LHRAAAAALAADDLTQARGVTDRLIAFYRGREDTRWGRERLAERAGEQLDAGGLLALAEEVLLVPLDKAATREVEAAARQVATVTALVPIALADVATALQGVRADLATVALDHQGDGTGASAAALLALWAEGQDNPKAQKLAFNIDPLSTLVQTGTISGGLDATFAKIAALTQALALRFPLATALRIDARAVHEAGGTEAQELGALMASAVDTLRRLEAAGLPLAQGAAQMLFTLSVDGNYGIGIAKLRSARRLWARVQEALGLDPAPMRLQAVTSARMMTRFDPWVNMLRGTSACFAGAVGGADVITVRAFNQALGRPEELGRRVARNTQIIAMEESGLGRVSDPAGGAWFSEALGEDLAQAAWTEFQTIESEGGYAASLIAGAFQARIAKAREALMRDVARRKVVITGVSEFARLGGVEAPIAEVVSLTPGSGVDHAGLRVMIPGFAAEAGEDAVAQVLAPMRVAEPFETLRDRAEAYLATTSKRPAIYIATLGPLAEHTGRVGFARNLFAAGGIEAVEADSFKASGCAIAVICGSDKRYESEAADAAKALKAAGALRVWIAGKFEGDGVDSHVFMGCDAVHEAALALAELGVSE
ncbi:MAG: methylmalonyl-CoA mutase family protein, partial [Henriciella sp.]|nr:methylmalonyl-CoA mutase family protein [Henriciella sp.]